MDENPALFLARFTEVVQKYTNLDITTSAGLLYLHVQFTRRSTPDIRRKLRQLEKGRDHPQRDLLEVAFKVFNNREEEARREKDHERKAKYAFLVAAIKGRDQPSPSHPKLGLKIPPGPCFRCNQSEHWAKACPNSWPPTKACPICPDGLSPGTFWHPWGGPHLPNLESGMSTGMPQSLWKDPHISSEPQLNPTRVVSMMGPGFQPPCSCPRHKLGT